MSALMIASASGDTAVGSYPAATHIKASISALASRSFGLILFIRTYLLSLAQTGLSQPLLHPGRRLNGVYGSFCPTSITNRQSPVNHDAESVSGLRSTPLSIFKPARGRGILAADCFSLLQ